MLLQYATFLLAIYETVAGVSVSKSSSGGSRYNSESKSSSHSESSSHHSKKGGHSSYRSISGDSDFDFPIRYRINYASDFDFYDPDIDPDFIGITSSLEFDPDLDFDLDLDYDLSDVDLDIDLLKLKYGFYGLNYLSLHEPHFNDYRFRRRLRYGRRPHYRLYHRHYPEYWKRDLEFWGLDNYGLDYDYIKYGYDISTPTSYVHVRHYSK